MKLLARLRPSPAMVVGCIALGVALGGTSVAAINALPKNSVGTKQLKNGAVTKKKINKKTIAQLKGNRGPRGPQGAQGAQGAQGIQGIQGIQGPPGPFAEVLPLSQAMRGDFAVSGSGAGAFPILTGVDFGFQLPAALGAAAVHFIPLGGPVPAGCSGTPVSPNASPGNLCMFERANQNRTVEGIFNSAGGPGADRTGAVVSITIVAAGVGFSAGTWAVRAPATATPGIPEAPTSGAPFGG
jgi:hypothetical protein